MTARPNSEQLPFGDFIEYLRHGGFTVSTAHYLRLQILLNGLKSDCSPEDLKTLLCPIFATSKEQQEKFYRIFDDFFIALTPAARADSALSKTAEPVAQESEIIPRTRIASTVRWLGPTVLTLGLVVAISFTAYVAQRLQRPSATALKALDNAEQDESSAGLPQSGGATANATERGRNRATGAVSDGELQPALRQSVIEVDVLPPAGTTGFTAADIKYEDFYHRYGEGGRWVLIAAPPLLLLLYEVRRFRRRSLILSRQRGKKPPSVWPIRIPETKLDVYNSELFYRTARMLRRRQHTQAYRLNVPATIAATIDSLGYLNFRYEPDSSPPEYLFLIDRRSPRDHQAQLFAALSRKLEADGVYLETYYFNADPRVCFRENGGRAVRLDELSHKYSGHRLVLFTDAEGLISPISGKLEPWTSLFKGWQAKTILGPAFLARWFVRELSVAGEFSVFPASLAGISAWADALGNNDDVEGFGRVQDWPTRYPLLDATDPAQKVEEVQRYLGDDVFKWLCACSVYPELHWDLTLFLGSLPMMGDGLVSEEHLLRLLSLPYFRSGVIPDDLRWQLIQHLGADRESAVRQALISILEKNPPPDESFAADNYQLNLVVQRWLVRPNFKRWLTVRERVQETSPARILQDLTLVKFVEAASPFAFILPRRLYSIFFRHGYPALGSRTAIRFLICLSLSTAAWLGIKRVAPTHTYYKSEQALVGHTGGINSLAFTTTGARLATAGGDRLIILWEADHDRWRPVGYLRDADPVVTAVALSNSGRFVAGAGGDGANLNRISLWDTDSSELLWQAEVAPPIKSVFFSSDFDNWLVVTHQDNQVALFNPADGSLVRRITGQVNSLSSATLSRDSSTLATGGATTRFSFINGWEPDLILWNPFTGKAKQIISTGEGVSSLAISGDGKTLITGGDKGQVTLWDAQSGSDVISFESAGAQVRSVASSTDGKEIAGIDGNNTLRIWEAQAGDLWLNYELGPAEVEPRALSFSPEGDVLVAEAGQGSTVRLIRLRDKNRASSSPAAPALADNRSTPEAAIMHTSQGKLMWVDENGDLVRPVKPPDRMDSYSFLIHGLQDTEDEITKAQNKARMLLYFDLVKLWGDRGIGGRVSEVELDDLNNVRVHLAGNDAGIEVILGDKDFGQRLERALRVLDENKGLHISYVNATSDRNVLLGFTTKSADGDGVTRGRAASLPK